MPTAKGLAGQGNRSPSSVHLVADAAHLLRHPGHEVRTHEGTLGAQGDAHDGGHRLQAVVVIVFEGEDIGVARRAEKRLFEGAGLIDYFVEHVVGSHTGLAFYNEEGVGLDEDHVELIVVLGAGTRDAHTDGYLLGVDEAQEGIIYILLEPASGKVINLGRKEHVFLFGDKAYGVDQRRKAGDSISSVTTTEGDVVDGHRLAHSTIEEPELFEGFESSVGQPTGAEAVEDPQGIVLAAGGSVAALLQVVAEAMNTEVLVERHAVADGVNRVGAVIVSAVERRIDNKILTCLHIEEARVELGKDMLDS